jgi:N-acetylmuramoyl-L-alanine amidase
MFCLDEAKKKLVSDGTPINQTHVDPNSRAGLEPKNLIIRCSGGPSLTNAVDQYLSNANSVHALIERNGKDIAQMVDFDRVAVHANEYDGSSLGVELIYPGRLVELPGRWNSKERYDPLEMILAQSANDNKPRWWPFHPQEQLDALLEIARLLDQEFGLERILVRHEINRFDLNSGPAFPINRLRQLMTDEGTATELLEETSAAADLFLQPDGGGPKVLEQPIPAQTPIAVTDEQGEWVLVEVMATLGERRWTVGWMQADKVAAKPFTPKVNAEHLLVTEDNRRIKFIAAHEKNFNPNVELKPRFVVIHFTTGTNLQSTIYTFLDPEEGVSSHLLVGRNGRVVQFVPFDRVAFHCGLSTWEGERDLNRFAIGIEVDNAGYLRTTEQGFKRKGKLIPDDQVMKKRHWKELGERPWQTFTEEQIRVVREIVGALKERYPTIQEIVGHDMVNLINRLDPGPLYPLGELREAILGDPQPAIKAYRTTQECPIYENLANRPPNVPHPDWGELPEKSQVRVREVHDKWSFVKVKQSSKSKLREKEGWVRSNSIEPEEDKAKTKFSQTFYKVIPAVEARLPGIELEASQLPKGTQVRKQFEVGEEWVLVAPVLEVRKDAEGRYEVVVPEDKVPRKFLEGWVKQEFLEEAGG